MNHDKDREDVDPHRGASNVRKRQQRQRNSVVNNNCSPCSYNRNNLQQSPREFQQNQRPWHMHPCNGNACSIQPQLPQWQYFTRHRPFGESSRPYQFPPLPHFPQQFQFGTFPGRNSPRLRHRREHLNVRGCNNISPDSHLHNYHDIPNDASVRPKTVPFMNGKKKFSKNKHSHDSSKSSKTKKERVNETSPSCSGGEDIIFHTSTTTAKENLAEHDGMKVSKSCDGSWLNEVIPEDSLAYVPDNYSSETELVEEGAVGGIPISSNSTVRAGNESGSLLDKDLIDEGAIFDLDNIFQNHEISRNSDKHFVDGSESEDDLEFAFDFDTKQNDKEVLSDDEFKNVCRGNKVFIGGHNTVSCWNEIKKDSTCSQKNSEDYVNMNSGIHFHNNQSIGNISNNNGRNELPDSDGGEDTGDFIDTDLPSHAKHILSSSDEMDNQSSAKESDDEENYEDNCYSHAKKVNSHSDFNCNDLSTLEPHLLNGLSDLHINSLERKDNEVQHDSDIVTLPSSCDVKGKYSKVVNSNVDENLAQVNEFKCRNYGNSHHNVCRSHSTMLPSFIRPDITHSALYGAAADILPLRENTLCFTDHLGADCEFPSSLECSHSSSINSKICTAVKLDCHHHGQCVEHSELSASGGRCLQRLNPLSQSCILGSNGSGTSTAEERSECCSHDCKLYHGQLNNLDSARHRNQGHVANGFNDELSRNFTAEVNCVQNCPIAGITEDGATISASAAERELDANSDLPEHVSNVDSVMSGGSEDPLNFENNGDHVDMVLLPMEEEIEPVHSIDSSSLCSGNSDFDSEEGPFQNIPSGFHSSLVNIHPITNSNRSYEDFHGPHIRDPLSLGNRLPSKEFYELIKRVSATNSYMRFFDKDGQDVQRSPPKTSNDEDNGPKGKHIKRSSGSRGDCLKVDRVMIWNEYEAYVVQYKQIAVSACGQTAVLNVLKALKFQCEKSVVCKVIKTNLRKDDRDIPDYLFSRACAGTTAVELMSGVEKLTGGIIGGRFFHFWPPRKVKLLQWLAFWMKRGAIPMATLNLQQGPHSMWEVPDSWHHQMVYGVSHQGLYLTNPLEIVSERSAVKQLHSDSVLLVRRQDIVSRFRESTDLGQLLDHPDPRWMSMNVLGQVVNVLRECNMPSVPGYRLQVTSHVRIPASYQAGVTLFMRKDQPNWNALVTAPELPLE